MARRGPADRYPTRFLDPWLLAVAIAASLGASYRTDNFLVTAASEPLAREVAERAEGYRQQLSVEWLGAELPPWSDPCPIFVDIGDQYLPCGETSYMFRGTEPVGWHMHVRGSLDAVMESVLPHEITHAVFATYFGRPVPRWAEEGACVTVENARERAKLDQIVPLQVRRGENFHVEELFTLTDYPPNVLSLYAQSYSLVRFLTELGGKQKFVHYLADGVRGRDWSRATHKHYGYENLGELQAAWITWLSAKSAGAPIVRPVVATAP